jgi:hypothetical protein
MRAKAVRQPQNSTLRACGGRFALKILPIELPVQRWPAVIVTLKGRTLSPVAERFIQYVRDFTRPVCTDQRALRR